MVPRPRAVFGRYPRRELLQSAEASNCVGTGSLREQRGSFRRSLSQSHRESSPDIIPLLLPTTPDLQVNQSLSRSSCVHPPMKPALDSLATRNGCSASPLTTPQLELSQRMTASGLMTIRALCDAGQATCPIVFYNTLELLAGHLCCVLHTSEHLCVQNAKTFAILSKAILPLRSLELKPGDRPEDS